MDNTRKTFSKLGIAFAAALIVCEGAGFLFSLLFEKLGSDVDSYIFKLIMSVVCNYLIGGLTLYIHLKELDVEESVKSSLTIKTFIILFVIAESVGISTNIVGNIVADVLSGGTATNPINEISELSFFTVVVTVVIAPICEEFMCRKLVIDRIIRYGEKTAMIVSGLIFGLFHTNIYQFFYAFLIGMLLAYIYIRTNDIRYPIVFHAFFNFFGGVIPLLVLKNADVIANLGMVSDEVLISEYSSVIIPILLYMVFEFIIFVVGAILLSVNYKKMFFISKEQEIDKDTVIKKTWLNPGMIIYTVISLIFTFIVLFGN